jgi:hypothetical protein
VYLNKSSNSPIVYKLVKPEEGRNVKLEGDILSKLRGKFFYYNEEFVILF